MTFDPFGDFEGRGYLRNVEQEKDLDIVRRLEHVSFTTGLDDAFKQLAGIKKLSYEDVLDTHRRYSRRCIHGQARTEPTTRLSLR